TGRHGLGARDVQGARLAQGPPFAAIEAMRPFLLALFLLPATACSGNSPSGPTPVDREVVLAPGQTAEFDSGLSVRFVSVIGDSRCPIDAVCITGGDAIVRIHVAAGTGGGDRGTGERTAE